jgi:diguanylate cyclase (GGDEF)-like protein
MIVEDERIVALDLRGALEELGYIIIGSAMSSEGALRAVERVRPDLVLMDIRIAGQTDGIETARILRTRYGIPVVYLTASADEATLVRALDTDPVGYLMKPYSHDALRATIEVAFRRHERELAARCAHELETAQLQRETAAACRRAEQSGHDATIDALTGLFNRRHLDQTMQREMSFARRNGHAVGVLLLDLDRFKQLNDTYGHATGDVALRAVADFLRARLRSYDVACRYGGEEIVIVAPGTEPDAVATLAEHLRAGIEQLVVTHRSHTSSSPPKITASFGVSSFPHHGDTPDTVFQAADRALYQAKAEGRNRVVRARLADPA